MSTIVQRSTFIRSERIAGGILPRVLSSFDMVAIFVAIVLFVQNAAVVTGGAGAAAYTYWILGFITFLVPGAIVTGQLGLMFPGEGSIYVWTTKAFGNFLGFLAGFCAWWPGILVLIVAGDAVVAFIQNLGSLYHLPLLPDSDSGSQGLVIILIITISFLLSVLRFRLTQNLVNMIFLAYGSAIVLIGVAGVLWLLTGHASNTDLSLQTAKWVPNGNNYTFYGTVVLALLGIEVPLNMGVEIKDTSSITRYLLWGSVVVMAAYLIATFGVMIAVPAGNQGDPTAVVEAIHIGFGGPLGLFLATVANLFLIGFFVFVSTVYNYSFARLIFVSGLDRRLPIVMSKINGNKVPWIAVLVQSAIAALLSTLAFILAPFVFPTGEHVSTIIYDILQAAIAVIWCISMVILFIDVISIRYKFQDAFARIRLAPDWVFYLCSITGTIASIFGVYVNFTASWTKKLSTAQWDTWLVGIVFISLIAAVIVFIMGRRAIRSDMSDEELIAEVTR